jgi:formate C-acetyltransferase
VAGLDQLNAPGTLVVNIRFSKRMLRPENRQHVKDLIRAYFRMGGMQIQVNVVDQEVLLDAIAHPERHGDLIIRIGGYSEYFNNLSHALKLTVLERTEHE